MTRKIDYLFLRNGSRNWHIKLQYPGGRIEKSLGTSDRAQAEILALPYIQDHKVRLLEARPGIQVTWLHRFAPGQEHITPDGERIIADDRELIFLNHNGAIVRKEPNGEFAVALPPLREQKAIVRREEQRRKRTATSPDDALIETYLKHKNVTGYYEREARAVWALYKQLTNSKPLKDASRDDGRKLVDYFEKQDLKSVRHRAQDRLRAAGCPEDLRWAILGHEQKTVAAGYGEGFPVPLLRRWIDKIGF
jgi:hypothetical protein